MPKVTPFTPKDVLDLVLSNNVIRAPNYNVDKKGNLRLGLREWGADIVPALMDVFRIEKNSGEAHSNSWSGFTRHWKGEVLRLDFDLVTDSTESVIVVTSIAGQEGKHSISDEDFGNIEVPEEIPTEQEWKKRLRTIQKARRAEDKDGSLAVKAYMAALSGWKKEIAQRFDEIVSRELPEVRSEVKWHTPFYGVEDKGWFVQIGEFAKYVKITFMKGSSLNPEPPGVIKNQEGRFININAKDEFDEEQIVSWIKQASAIPGWFAK